jgi:hypothetical protein
LQEGIFVYESKEIAEKGQFRACILHSRKNVYYRNRNASGHLAPGLLKAWPPESMEAPGLRAPGGSLASGPRAWPPEDWKLGNIYATNCIDIRKNEKNLGVIS